MAISPKPRKRSCPAPARPARSDPTHCPSSEYKIATATRATAAPRPPSSNPSTIEGAADVAERGADQRHDFELIATRVKGETHDRPDGKGGAQHQDAGDHERRPRGRCVTTPSSRDSHRRSNRTSPTPARPDTSRASVSAAASASAVGPQPHLQRRRKRVLRERRGDVGELREVGAEALERPLFRHVFDGRDFGTRAQHLLERLAFRIGGGVLQVDGNLGGFEPAIEHALHVHRDQQEAAERDEGDRDRADRDQRRPPGTPQAGERLFEGVANHGHDAGSAVPACRPCSS